MTHCQDHGFYIIPLTTKKALFFVRSDSSLAQQTITGRFTAFQVIGRKPGTKQSMGLYTAFEFSEAKRYMAEKTAQWERRRVLRKERPTIFVQRMATA